jgi:hypothetical protein
MAKEKGRTPPGTLLMQGSKRPQPYIDARTVLGVIRCWGRAMALAAHLPLQGLKVLM